MLDGWIKLHRTIKDHWIFNDHDRLRAWIIMLMDVNHLHQKVIIRGEVYECDAGQSLYSYDTWASIFGKGWTKQKVRTFFSLLENDQMITHEGLHYTTRITICNYKTYQSQDDKKSKKINTPTNTPITHGQHTDNTPITPNKNEKNGNNEKKNTYSLEFSTFLDAYPKITDEDGTLMEFRKVMKTTTLGTLLNAIEQQKLNPNWSKEGGRWIPNSKKWLVEKRWKDTVKPIEDPQSWKALNRKLMEGATSGQDHLAIGRDF